MPDDTRSAVVLITGAGRGIGLATAKRMLLLGARVTLHVHGSDPGINHERAEVIRADLSQAQAATELVSVVVKRWGALDYVVNNAAYTPTANEAATPALWKRVFDVNLRAAEEISRAAAAVMSAERFPAIVNVGSASALRGGGSSAAIVASKGALHALTQFLARQFAPAVRVNAVLPGLIETEEIASRGPEFEARKQELLRNTPLHRAGNPDEVAEVIEFLLTGNTFITGQLVRVDGGLIT